MASYAHRSRSKHPLATTHGECTERQDIIHPQPVPLGAIDLLYSLKKIFQLCGRQKSRLVGTRINPRGRHTRHPPAPLLGPLFQSLDESFCILIANGTRWQRTNLYPYLILVLICEDAIGKIIEPTRLVLMESGKQIVLCVLDEVDDGVHRSPRRGIVAEVHDGVCISGHSYIGGVQRNLPQRIVIRRAVSWISVWQR